jgi:hypothetical protein
MTDEDLKLIEQARIRLANGRADGLDLHRIRAGERYQRSKEMARKDGCDASETPRESPLTLESVDYACEVTIEKMTDLIVDLQERVATLEAQARAAPITVAKWLGDAIEQPLGEHIEEVISSRMAAALKARRCECSDCGEQRVKLWKPGDAA